MASEDTDRKYDVDLQFYIDDYGSRGKWDRFEKVIYDLTKSWPESDSRRKNYQLLAKELNKLYKKLVESETKCKELQSKYENKAQVW